MDKPKTPCRRDCEFRSASCHNESCPYGWAEYERQSIEFAKYVDQKREMHFATRPITDANRRYCHKVVMNKKQRGAV